MKIIFKNILAVAMLAIAVTSCKKDLLDINVDPNNPTTTSAGPELVLPAALNNMAGTYNNPTSDNRFAFAALWLGHISYSGNYAIATENVSYAITNNFGAALFGNVYDNLEDFDFVQKKGADLGNPFYRGIGTLMKAYNFQTLVDIYNNVPYSEALQGTAIARPKYDDAKTIYDDLGKQIDTAIALFKVTPAGTLSTGDILFNGNVDNWLKFAYTVKLRLLLRQSEKSDRAAYIQGEVAKLAGATFLDVDAKVNPGYLNSAGKTNQFWGANVNTSLTYTQDFYRAGQFVIDIYKAHNDPRLAMVFAPAIATGQFQGNYFGDQGIPNSKTSTFGSLQSYAPPATLPAKGLMKTYGQGSVVMLAAESYFLQAEAVLRGWIPGDAKALYTLGVEKSFAYLDLTKAQADTYIAQAGDKDVNWDATTSFQEKLALIIRQKWLALSVINELEPYNDYRRLHLPADIPLSTSPYSTGKMPTRLLYPQREFEVNQENVPSGITATSNVWWMP
jgi:hypothetical protein